MPVRPHVPLRLLLGSVFLLLACSAATTPRSVPPTTESPLSSASQACWASSAPSVREARTRRAVGAQSLELYTCNIDALNPSTNFTYFFDPPLTNWTSDRGWCSGTEYGESCSLHFYFSPLPESYTGRALFVRVQANGTFITYWTQVATIMPAPVLLPSVTEVEQYNATLTIRGLHLGLPNGTAQDMPTITFPFAFNVNGDVVSLNQNATSALVSLWNPPYLLGALNATVTLWGVTTAVVQVATIVPVTVDATSVLTCNGYYPPLSLIANNVVWCEIGIRGNGQNILGNLTDFNIGLSRGLGVLGDPTMPTPRLIQFTYTAPSSAGVDTLIVTSVGDANANIVNSPFTIFIQAPSPSPSPWLPPLDNGGGGNFTLLYVGLAACGAILVVSFCLAVGWLRGRQRRLRGATDNAQERLRLNSGAVEYHHERLHPSSGSVDYLPEGIVHSNPDNIRLV